MAILSMSVQSMHDRGSANGMPAVCWVGSSALNYQCFWEGWAYCLPLLFGLLRQHLAHLVAGDLELVGDSGLRVA
jgi:hypothetical protein